MREKGKATKKGDMGPPPVPGDLNAGFMTPKPLTGSSRKARMVESKSAFLLCCGGKEMVS